MVRSACLAAVLAAAMFACSSSRTATSESHTQWLGKCERDSDCGSFLCVCNVCVGACDADRKCHVQGRKTECVTSTAMPARAICGQPAPAPICLESCAAKSCPNGQMCMAGACVPSVARLSDGGSGRSGDAGGGGGAGGSSGAGGTHGAGGSGGTVDAGTPRADAGDAGGNAAPDAGNDAGSSTIDCTIRPSLFPGFDRSCTQASDCAVVAHQRDCCGTRVMLGIRADQAASFEAAEKQCEAQYPACGCAEQLPSADDGTMFDMQASLPASVDCVGNVCQSTFKSPSKTVCGPNLTCNTATEVCVAREPVGPAIVYECKPVPPGCEQDRSCRCTAQTCTAGFNTCQDQGWNNIDCVCPMCQ